MSTTIYYTGEKSESVTALIEAVNSDSEHDWEFVPVDSEWGITDEEYLVHLDDTKVLVTPKDDPPWPAKPSDAPKRAALSGWQHFPDIKNKDIGASVNFSIYRACLNFG